MTAVQCPGDVLIETYWNVNVLTPDRENKRQNGLNRNILECKLNFRYNDIRCRLRLNRNILECKFYR